MFKVTQFISRRFSIKPWSLATDLPADPLGKWPVFVRFSSSGVAKMSAWQIHQYGGVGELILSNSARLATIKSPDELLIKVHSASINPIDVRMLGGYGAALINILRKQKGVIKSGSEFPLTLGRDFSGTVIETGRAVTKFKVGDEVWGALGAERPGAHAEFAVTSQYEISKKPKNLSHMEAASMPYVTATTWVGLCTVGQLEEKSAAGRRLLILGGSGGIGTFAIQLAKAWGMDVSVTCRADAEGVVRQLGADHVFDYTRPDVWRALRQAEKFHYILDTVGGETTDRAAQLLSPWENSKLVTLVSPLLRNTDSMGVVSGLVKTAFSAGLDTLKKCGKGNLADWWPTPDYHDFFNLEPESLEQIGLQKGGSVRWAIFVPNGRALDRVRQMVEMGQIKPVVQEVFPFSEVPTAFVTVSDGHLRGKIVIDTRAKAG